MATFVQTRPGTELATATKRRHVNTTWILPVTASVAFSAVFVARSAVHTANGVTFSLFDDAMISMRYGQNLAQGHGLAWNLTGHPVEGYTNFLWTLVMALIQRLGFRGGAASLCVMVLGVALIAATIILSGRLARLLAPSLAHADTVAMWLVALFYPLAYWTLRGMEVGLIAALLTAAVYTAVLHARSGRTWLLVATTVLCMAATATRDDVLLPVLVIAGYVAWSSPGHRLRSASIVLGGIAMVTLAHELFRMLYYGDWLPNTYYLKIAGTTLRTRLRRSVPWMGDLVLGHLAILLALACGWLVAERRGRRLTAAAVAIAGIILVQLAYDLYAGGDVWEFTRFANRFISSTAPFLLILAALGICTLASAEAAVRRRWCAVLALFMAVVTVFSLRDWFLPYLPDMEPMTTLQLASRVSAAAVAAAVVGLAGLRWRRGIVVGLLAGAAIVAPNLYALVGWSHDNATYVAADAACVRYGLQLRQATRPGATIAVGAAGAIPYFAERTAFDMMGKSDPVIAHESPHPVFFHPGHTKWDYSWTIKALRPDVVAQLWWREQDAATVRQIEAWGYDEVSPNVFVRHDSTLVDRAALRETETLACA